MCCAHMAAAQMRGTRHKESIWFGHTELEGNVERLYINAVGLCLCSEITMSCVLWSHKELHWEYLRRKRFGSRTKAERVVQYYCLDL